MESLRRAFGPLYRPHQSIFSIGRKRRVEFSYRAECRRFVKALELAGVVDFTIRKIGDAVRHHS